MGVRVHGDHKCSRCGHVDRVKFYTDKLEEAHVEGTNITIEP